MIRHLLLVRFKPSALPEDIEIVLQAFLRLPDSIEGLTAVEWGENDSVEGKNAGFTHCVLMSFLDALALDRYQTHPAHLVLKGVFRPVLAEIIVLDYQPQVFTDPD